MAYEFTAQSKAGAVLILPSGATLHDLPQDKYKYYLRSFQEAATEHARLWCESSDQHSLYLVTGMYKTRDFILTSFNTGRPNQEMHVKSGKYEWKCGFTVYSRTSPPSNKYENQTILIKGFRMTVRWSLPVVEQVTQAPSQISRWIASLIAFLAALLQVVFDTLSKWLSRTSELFYYVAPKILTGCSRRAHSTFNSGWYFYFTYLILG